jgi:AraC-like DNA-binding protein
LVQEAIRRMYAEFQSPLSLSELADTLGCSTGYFQRVFRRVTGTSPGRYLTQIRLEHAILWLQGSELSISEVAAKVGYQDPLYFSRAIRKAFGRSPTQIRLESVSNSDGAASR